MQSCYNIIEYFPMLCIKTPDLFDTGSLYLLISLTYSLYLATPFSSDSNQSRFLYLWILFVLLCLFLSFVF